MENPGCGLVRMNWTVQKREQQAKERNPDQVDLEDRALARAKIETLSVNAPGSSLKTKLDSPVTLGPPDLGTAGGNAKLWNRIGHAWVALLLVAQLYRVEQQAQPMAPEDRLQLRQRQSRPILIGCVTI
jgi:hypothetical protein